MAHEIPPFGMITDDPASHIGVVSYLNDLRRECRSDRDPWALLADKNNTVYLYGENPAPPATKRVLNPIQNAVLADVVIQTRERIQITLNPAETGDPGEIYFADPEMYGVDPLTGMPNPATPLDPKMVAAMQQPQPVTDEMGQPLADPMDPTGRTPALQPGAPAEAFIVLDDQLNAEIWQSVFDRLWKRSQLHEDLQDWLKDNEVHGWWFGLYEWDDRARKHAIRELSVWQTYMDPTVRRLKKATYAGIDVVYDVDEAAKLYPAFAEQIRAMAKDGPPNKEADATLGRADMNYERKVVTLGVWWLRNQPFPMSEEEAVQSGEVEQIPVLEVMDGLSSASLVQPGVGSGELPDSGATGVEGRPLVERMEASAGNVDGEGVGSLPLASDPGNVVSLDQAGGGDLAMAQPQSLSVYILPDGTEVAPGAPGWPTRLGIRQITVIENAVVDDRECEHDDIPLLHNVNRPIPGKPWGIGEPMFLANQQKAYNGIVDGAVEFAEWFKNPARAMPQSLKDALEKEFGKAYLDPGTTVGIPDEFLLTHPNFDPSKMFWVPSEMSRTPIEMAALLKKDINEQSGHTDAIRGILPSAQTSGKAVELLQESGTQMIQHKSQSTEAMLERLANLMHFTHIWRLEVADIMQIVSKYPDYVIEAAIRKARGSEFDIDVVVASGTGQIIAAKKQEAVQAFQVRDPQTGEPLQGIEATRDALKIDHTEEREKWQADMAMVAMAQQQQAAQNPEQGKNGKPNGQAKSANGNGRL